MKKIFYICLLISAMTVLAACSTDRNSLIIGTWVLQKAEYENLEKFCRHKYEMFIDGIDNSVSMIDRELSTTINDDEKEKLRLKREKLTESKAGTSFEKVKESILKQAESLCGKQIYTFDEKGKFSIRVDQESVNGTYKINGDTIQTVIENQNSDIYFIKKIEHNDMELSVVIQDAKLNLTLNRK